MRGEHAKVPNLRREEAELLERSLQVHVVRMALTSASTGHRSGTIWSLSSSFVMLTPLVANPPIAL